MSAEYSGGSNKNKVTNTGIDSYSKCKHQPSKRLLQNRSENSHDDHINLRSCIYFYQKKKSSHFFKWKRSEYCQKRNFFFMDSLYYNLQKVEIYSIYKSYQKVSTKWLSDLGNNGEVILAILLTSLVLSLTGVSCQVCGPPAVPANAKVKTVSGDLGIYEAKYECDSGYELFGSDVLKCDPVKGWDRELPHCGTNVAYRKPVNQSSYTRQGPPTFANDGEPGNNGPDGQKCSETQKEASPWWRVDLLQAYAIRVVRITTRGCCGHQPLQDLEIRVGNSSADLQRNPLCAWYPGTVDEGTTKTFTCARPLVGQYVAIQLVGVEGSLSLCEVEVFTSDEFSADRCISTNLNADTILTTFSKTCYEFYIARGENFERAQQTCKLNGGNLIHNMRGPTQEYILAELERRKSDLKTQLVWIGAQKEPGITSRTWKWINGDVVSKPAWGKDQPNNYNGEQNCVALDGGRIWLWNDVGCNLDYLPFICQHMPLSCGSPDSSVNTTVAGKNYSMSNTIIYSCPQGHALIGNATRECLKQGIWSGSAPTCQYVDCGALSPLEHGMIILSDHRTSYGAQATYTCHENYTLIGNENRTCEILGWTGESPQCLVDWCPQPPNITGGQVKVTNQRAGSTAAYECDYGYVMIGDAVLSCGLGGEWSGKPPTCRFIDCGAPGRPDRGKVTLTNSSTTVGSIVKYNCEDDYWLVGASELFCTKEGKWSGEPPICELITCDTPTVPPGSYVVGYDYNVHSSIQYYCDPGHVMRGMSSLECLEVGEWSGDAPFCEYIDCGSLTPIPYGFHTYQQNTTYVGSEITFSCVNTHKLNGPSKRTCLESGLWSDVSPKCEEIRCQEPILAPHSILSVTGNDRMYGRTLIKTADSPSSNVQTYKVGALAKYRCERGYKIVGDPLVTCEDNGSWSGLIPECLYVDCGSPSTIQRGKVTLPTNATYYGAAALYECDGNYKLDGVSRRLCMEDGTWSHDTPTCREITCQEPDVSEHILVESGTRSVGDIANFSCQKGRILIGNTTRICLKNGQWTGKSPVCKPIDCGRPLPIENGRVILVNDSSFYGGSAEYHCVPNYNRIGQYLRKCLEDGKWSGEEPRCEIVANKAQESSNLGTGIAIGATIIVILLIIIGLIFLHRNKLRPVKNTENIQAAETKEDRSASVMSYSTLDASSRSQIDVPNPATFNTFHHQNRNRTNNNRPTENIYDQIPNEQHYDAPYEMRTNEEVYEPEPILNNMITINGISVR